MKKAIALLLSTLLALSIISCSNQDDAAYIKGKGKLIIGITYFEPMNYLDENHELTGFETEFAKEVCKIIGVEPVFQEINWDIKVVELEGKTIDCIWNGMTITPELSQKTNITKAYMKNRQVLVVRSADATKYTDAASLKGAKLVAEMESAGESVAKENDVFSQASYVAVDSMKTAIMEVSMGTADCCLVDYVTSIGMIGEGTSYNDLVVVDSFSFSPEEYGIAFRNGSTMTQLVNSAIDTLLANGKLAELAEKYKLSAQLIAG